MTRFALGIIVAACGLAGAAFAFERTLTADRLVRDFQRATERSAGDGIKGPLRWQAETLRVAFAVDSARDDVLSGTLNAPWIDVRDTVLAQTDMALSIGTWADTDPRPQVFVMAADADRLLAKAPRLETDFDAAPFAQTLAASAAKGEGLCHSFASFDARGVMEYALITVDLDADPAYCFKRQALIVLGLTEPLQGASNSILSGPLRSRDITTLDAGLIAMLYDPRLPQGRDVDTATLHAIATDVVARIAEE